MKNHRIVFGLILALCVAVGAGTLRAAKTMAQISQCQKNKIRNDKKELVYVFTVQSRQAGLSGKTEAWLHVEAQDGMRNRYFGSLQNRQSLLSYVRGGTYADVTWRFEVNVNPLSNPTIKAYCVELIDTPTTNTLDVAKYAVGDVTQWKTQNATSRPLAIKALSPSPALE